MPSLTHEALILLFRNRPQLAPELLHDVLGVELPPFAEARVESAEITDVAPAEYRADLVVLLVDGKPVFAIVLEVQLARDERKRYSWPVYVTGVRARFECATALLVVTPAPDVARWAAAAIAIGPGCMLTPLVLGPDGIPVVVDPDVARADPELAVLSAMAHGARDVDQAVRIALAAVAGTERVTDPERVLLYLDLVKSALSEAARKAFAMWPQGYQLQDEGFRKSFENGIEKGRAKERAASVLAVLEARGIAVDGEQRARIEACTDLPTLAVWLRRAVTAASAGELFT